MTSGITLASYGSIDSYLTDTIKGYVEVQPITATLAADYTSFLTYSSGLYADSNCGLTPNHDVLIIGYGTFNSIEYWLIKNSWGTDWGESGFMRMTILQTSTGGYCSMLSGYVYWPTISPQTNITKSDMWHQYAGTGAMVGALGVGSFVIGALS